MNKIEDSNLRLMIESIDYDDNSFGREIISNIFNGESKVINKLINLKCNGDLYSFNYLFKEYRFKKLSDFSLIPSGVREELKNKVVKSSETIPRILRLAVSKSLINPRLLICYDMDLIMLIEFRYNGNTYIIDYYNDLIMNKDDYFYLCKTKIINEVGLSEIYKLYNLIKDNDYFINLLYFLLFPNDIIGELCNISDKRSGKFSKDGINLSSYAVFGDSCDDIFLVGKDKYFNQVLEEIEYFTREIKETDHIKIMGDNILYKDEKREFLFMLFSDLVIDDEIKRILCSYDRYHTCHVSSWKYVRSVMEVFGEKSVSIVGGKYKINDIDYYYHTWIELVIEGEAFVIDYTKNLIINRDRYYELTGAKVINVVGCSDIKRIIDNVIVGNLCLNPMEYSYFAQELLNDLERNKHILKR